MLRRSRRPTLEADVEAESEDDKGIYFCTNSIIDYGRLSSQNIDKLYKNVHRKNVFLKQNS
ncbi:MAG: hypothetical protein Q8786_02515, partial [Sweet potato little leaf phytoplasma]|nr:hypothetical protein [Sweet potato little leaf phytoplasma]